MLLHHRLALMRDVAQAIPASLGVSSVKDLDVNSLCVPRKAKEPIGGIARLSNSHGTVALPEEHGLMFWRLWLVIGGFDI